MKPSVLVLHAAGTNRDQEAAWACDLAGAEPQIVHLNQLRGGGNDSGHRMADHQMILLPGGFTYGDALGAGSRLALDINLYFEDELRSFVSKGNPVLGICNGFQVLVKAGILPGLDTETNGFEASKNRSVTLTENKHRRFECRWVHLIAAPNCVAEAITKIEEPIFCPVAHGEGNFQVKDDSVRRRLQQHGLVALYYADAEGKRANERYPLNPNGSIDDIAGICNPQGNVIGLMPHPEDHIVPAQNPLNAKGRLGLQLFEAMIGQL